MAANPYVEARREWDEAICRFRFGKRNWQIAAGGLLLVLAESGRAASSGSSAEAATFPTSSKSTNSDMR